MRMEGARGWPARWPVSQWHLPGLQPERGRAASMLPSGSPTLIIDMQVHSLVPDIVETKPFPGDGRRDWEQREQNMILRSWGSDPGPAE